MKEFWIFDFGFWIPEKKTIWIGSLSSPNLESKIRNLKWCGFVVAVVATFLLCAAVANAQPKPTPRIGLLVAGFPSSMATRVDAFRQKLRELGYVEGRNIFLEYRYAKRKPDHIPGFAAELVGLKVAVIVTWATPVTQAAKNATTTIPIVMAGGGGPVEAGVIASLAKPGGNVTGLASMQGELGGKRLELLKETFPKVFSVAVLWNPEEQSPAHGFKELQSVAPALGVKLQSFEERKPNEIDKAFAGIAKIRGGALLVESDPVFNINRAKVIDQAAKVSLPAIYPERRWVEDGGLMAYGTDLIDLARRLAVFVDKILKGTKPADLPVEQPMKFELTINLKAAKQIGMTIPQSVLFRADKVIK
jgi:putative ABC transport system substrate-binding protein